MKLFVYGTLKEGNRLNYLLSSDSCKKICDGTLKGFDMYTNGYYPYIVPVEDLTRTVTGEVWEVNSEPIMSDLRSIEREYEETEVDVYTEGGKERCLAYVYKNDIRDSWDKIENGTF